MLLISHRARIRTQAVRHQGLFLMCFIISYSRAHSKKPLYGGIRGKAGFEISKWLAVDVTPLFSSM